MGEVFWKAECVALERKAKKKHLSALLTVQWLHHTVSCDIAVVHVHKTIITVKKHKKGVRIASYIFHAYFIKTLKSWHTVVVNQESLITVIIPLLPDHERILNTVDYSALVQKMTCKTKPKLNDASLVQAWENKEHFCFQIYKSLLWIFLTVLLLNSSGI